MYGTEDFVRKVVGEEWKEELRKCQTEEEWMMTTDEKLDAYFEQRKLPANPKHNKKKEAKEKYEKLKKEEEKRKQEKMQKNGKGKKGER